MGADSEIFFPIASTLMEQQKCFNSPGLMKSVRLLVLLHKLQFSENVLAIYSVQLKCVPESQTRFSGSWLKR